MHFVNHFSTVFIKFVIFNNFMYLFLCNMSHTVPNTFKEKGLLKTLLSVFSAAPFL